MSVIAGNELFELIDGNIITADYENVNAASIDITLGEDLLVEYRPKKQVDPIDISEKESIDFLPIRTQTYILEPGAFILAHSRETFNLPNNISAEYKLKSSMARCGLEHLNAGWCDAGWHGSNLTLELKNMTLHNNLLLRAGMKIGQVIFYKHEEVPACQSYATKGRYNNNRGAQSSKGVQ